MARSEAAKIRQGLNPRNGKATKSAREVGAYGRTRPKADKSVRRAREVATDPRLQRARADQAKHEKALRALEEALAVVVELPRPAPEPLAQVVELPRPAPGAFVPATSVALQSPTMPTTPTRARTASSVETPRPDPEAWRIARDLAGGDVRRLRVVDRTTVLVLNNPVR